MTVIYKTLGKYHLTERVNEAPTLYDIDNEISFGLSKAYNFLGKAFSIV